MPYSLVATGIFAARNTGKTSNGDIGRLPVTIGQTTSVVKAASQYGNPFSRALKKGLTKLGSDKVAGKLGKVATWASKNVNPLLVASSGIKVVTAKKEERKSTLIKESGLLLGMFAGEGWMKKHLDKILDKLPVDKKWKPFIKGITFVAGSITCATLGHKAGTKVAQIWDKPSQKSEEQIQQAEPKVYEPLNIKA